jgi:2-oxoglutarate dehydrogenase E1 component
VLANVMAKGFRVIFHEFSGGTANPEDVGGSGDVKYHLGTSTDREFDGIKVHMSLVPNPSHLETVDPVVLGKVRAQLTFRDDLKAMDQVLPVLIHGDAAFAGQGIVWECPRFPGHSRLCDGRLHPLHREQPDRLHDLAAVRTQLALSFGRRQRRPGADLPRQRRRSRGGDFRLQARHRLPPEVRQGRRDRHVVLPPLRPQRGRRAELHPAADVRADSAAPAVSEIYARRLVQEGVIDHLYLGEYSDRFVATLEAEFEAAKSYKANEADWFAGRWSGFNKPNDPEGARRNVPTAIEQKLLDSLGRTLTTVPDDLQIHKTLAACSTPSARCSHGDGLRLGDRRGTGLRQPASEGYGVRLSGQDSGRGTFSQRHAVWVDQTDEHKYCRSRPCRTAASKCSTARCPNMACSASNMAMRCRPKTLVLWEAQFGDFANGAQIIIDQYIAAAEAKWLRANGLVLLLPHGYEGQGRSTARRGSSGSCSSARRTTCRSATSTSPANYFHVLRRQMHRGFRQAARRS